MPPLKPFIVLPFEAWLISSVQMSFSSRSLSFQAYTLYLFTCNNLNDIVVMGLVFGLLGAAASPVLGFNSCVSIAEATNRVPKMLFWSRTNLLLFNLHNQRHRGAILEDRVNKPWRPLPSGRFTASEASYLMYAMYPMVLVSSFSSGGLGPCLLEGFCCLWYNEWGGAETPILKNLLNAAGFVCFLAGPLEIAVGAESIINSTRASLWLIMIGMVIFTTVHTQDFRDMEGDMLRNRLTVPRVIGDKPARYVVAISVILWSTLASVLWQVGILGFLLPSSAGVLLISSLLRTEPTPETDALAWKIWPVWITSFFFTPLSSMA